MPVGVNVLISLYLAVGSPGYKLNGASFTLGGNQL